ncbi:hypothetical protein [Azospirillum sp. TSH58]|nr:hypothetical protein [Azospirillum sp. TSH58]
MIANDDFIEAHGVVPAVVELGGAGGGNLMGGTVLEVGGDASGTDL